MLDYDNTKKWYDFFKSKGFNISLIVIIAILLVIAFNKPEVFIYIKSFIFRLFAGVSSLFSKKHIQTEINGRILKAARSVCTELNEFLPYEVKIKWVTQSTRESFIQGNNIIVCMDHKRTRDQNVIYALNDYVTKGLLPREKFYVDDKTMKSSHLVMTRKLILLAYRRGLDYYVEDILMKVIREDDEIRKYVSDLICIDEKGLFVEAFLRELLMKSKEFYGKPHDDVFKDETKDLVKFFYDIASRDKGDMTNLDYIGKFFNIGVILVADDNTYLTYGLKAYTNRFRLKVSGGANSVYILAWGRSKIPIARKIYDILKKDASVTDSRASSFKFTTKAGHDTDGVCYWLGIDRIDRNDKDLYFYSKNVK